MQQDGRRSLTKLLPVCDPLRAGCVDEQPDIANVDQHPECDARASGAARRARPAADGITPRLIMLVAPQTTIR